MLIQPVMNMFQLSNKMIILIVLFAISATLAEEISLEEFTLGNTQFTGSVYNEIQKDEKGNFLVSPFSVQTVLALTHTGAKDQTAEEIRTALNLPNTKSKVEATFKDLIPKLKKTELYSLRTANKVYVKEDYPIKEEFKKAATELYGANFENINFTKKAAAIKNINGWVEDQTEKKIQNLVGEDDVTPLTRLILINALYFKGNWSIPFDSYNTNKKDFYKVNSKTVSVDTMHKTAKLNFHECSDMNAKFLELPFEGQDESASMIIVLPNERNGITKLEKQLANVFAAKNYTQELVHVALPKFKIKSTIDFVDILKRLGLKKPFLAEEADFSGISGKKGDLVVDKIKQKTFIDVREEGVEAAAATFVGISFASAALRPPQPKEFIADHPFIFYIKANNIILFGGRVMEF